MGIPESHSTEPKTHQQHIIDSQRELTQELHSVVNKYDTLKQFVTTTISTLEAELETKNKCLREQEPIMRQFREHEQARMLRIRGEVHARAANVTLMEQQREAQNKLVVTRHSTYRKSIDSIKMLGLFLKERRSNIGKIDFMGVNRTFITDPLHKMKKEGPAVLDIVEFDNEDGTGPGVVLDYFTQAFKKQMETYGTELFGFFLPPTNETVGNNIDIIENLRACGRLMIMGLLMAKPEYGRWHPYIYYFCLNPRNANEVFGSMASYKETTYFCTNFFELPTIDRQNLTEQLHCQGYWETVIAWSDRNIGVTENLNEMHLHAVYRTRSLAYQYIREGFHQGCDETHTDLLNIINPNRLLNHLSDQIRNKFNYNGADIADIIRFPDLNENIIDVATDIIYEYVTSQDAVEAVQLVEKWTGSPMKPDHLKVAIDTTRGATVRFATCDSLLMVGKRAFEGPSYNEVEEKISKADTVNNADDISYMRFRLTMEYVMLGTSTEFNIR